MRKHETGFTLIELLIVVAIIGILAAIAIPNLLTAMNRAKQKRTMGDMRELGRAWEARAVDESNYAAAGLDVACDVPMTAGEVRNILEPTYIRPFPDRDGWSVAFEFAVNGDASQYAIRSYGRDGVRDGELSGGATGHLDCDIVYSGGMFVQYPSGVQAQ